LVIIYFITEEEIDYLLKIKNMKKIAKFKKKYFDFFFNKTF